MTALATDRYSMTELERETGFSPRTIRFYITQGLLPPAHGRGPTATYDRGHLVRLKAIKHFKDRFLPLEAIKQRLGEMTDEEIEAELEIQRAPAADLWRRFELHPDVQLHVRQPGGQYRSRELKDAVDLIVDQAQAVIRRLEDQT